MALINFTISITQLSAKSARLLPKQHVCLFTLYIHGFVKRMD